MRYYYLTFEKELSSLKKKALSTLILTLLVSLFIVGCGKDDASNEGKTNGSLSDDEEVTIRMVWWGNKEVHERTQKVVDLFEEENPNIKVSTEFTGWDGYWDKLATQAAGQNLPDVVNIDIQYLSEYASRGLLADHNEFIEKGWLNFDDVDPSLLEGGEIDGKLYAINQGTNSPALTVDPAILEEAGITNFEPGYTWEDFIDIAKTVKEEFGDDMYVEGPQGLGDFGYYLRQHGLWLYNDEGTGLGYDDDQYLIDFLDMWQSLRDEDITPPQDVLNSVQGKEDVLLVHGDSPFHPLTSNEFVAVHQAADRPLELALYPALEGGEHGLYLKPGQFYAVSSHSEHPEAAAKLVDFFTNSKEAHEVLRAIYGVPISSVIQEHVAPLVDESTKQTFDYIDLVQDYSSPLSPPEPSGHGEINSAYDRIFEAMSYGELSPEEAAKRFREEAEAILAKNE